MKVTHGTTAWFQMAGSMMCAAASRAGLPATHKVALVERYTGGGKLPGGLVQGLRFDILDGKPSYRVGALDDEVADITIEITAEASHVLNSLYADDPRFAEAFADFLHSGELRIDGDLAALGSWFAAVHDAIVDRTVAYTRRGSG